MSMKAIRTPLSAVETEPESEQIEQLPQEEKEEVQALGAVIEESEEAPAQPGTMKIDLHCHSDASNDCSTPLQLIPLRCSERGIRVQAITDHNEIWGAKELQAMVSENQLPGSEKLTIIVGEEISTTHGEIVGLFLKERIEPGLSPAETVAQIKSQGGLVMIPHGFDPLKRWRLRPEALVEIEKEVDIIETFNARISRLRWNRAAVSWAEERQCLMSAGSDAHTLTDIGSAWVEVPYYPIHSPQDLLTALRGGTPVGVWTHPVIAYVYKAWDRFLRKMSLRNGR